MDSIAFPKELFGIILTAMMLTLFEIGFFIKTVAPTVSSKTKSMVRSFAESVSRKYPEIPQIPTVLIDSISFEEHDLIKKLNQSIIFDSFWVAAVLLIILSFLAWFIKGKKVGNLVVPGAFVLITIIAFIIFQYYFYRFVSLKYDYPGAQKNLQTATKAVLQAIQGRRVKPSKTNLFQRLYTCFCNLLT